MILLILINSCGWLLVHLSIAIVFTHMDARRFQRDCNHCRPSEFYLYRNWLQIRRWKHLLPDGARWLGGKFGRITLAARDPAYLQRLVLETRRSEAAHWIMFACCPVFVLWNPPHAWPILAAYAAAANLPCIAVQRYNRHILCRILWRRPNQT